MMFPLAIILAYLSGSIPSAVWIGRIVRGIDLRSHGSGNMGAANAARVLGLRWGVAAGIVDVAKGFAPVFWLGSILAQSSGGRLGVSDAQLILGVVAIFGHLFPVFAGFRGGKGVLTSLGVFAALLPFAVAIAALVWTIVFAISRIVSLGSLAAVLAFLGTVLVRRFVFHMPTADSLLIASVMLAVLFVYTHRSNLKRLAAGTEHQFRQK